MERIKIKNLTVLIPCYNEEEGIGKVIENIPKEKLKAIGYNVDVLVIDNNSKDKTSQVAKSKGANVLFEKKQGKGNAVLTGFKNIPKNTDIVVMLDGDNTYLSKEMIRLVEPLDTNFCDVVIGSRLQGKIHKESMSSFNKMGNWLFTFLVRTAYESNVTDVCTGYFAWKRHVVDHLSHYIASNGFTLEMEMITKMAKSGFTIYSVPISYQNREGSSNLHPIKDGSKIIMTWAEHLFWKPKKIAVKDPTLNAVTN